MLSVLRAFGLGRRTTENPLFVPPASVATRTDSTDDRPDKPRSNGLMGRLGGAKGFQKYVSLTLAAGFGVSAASQVGIQQITGVWDGRDRLVELGKK